jgi:hypothetical protein
VNQSKTAVLLQFFGQSDAPVVCQISGSGTSVADPLSSGVTTVAEQAIQNQLAWWQESAKSTGVV